MNSTDDPAPKQLATRLAHLGLDPQAYYGFVNPPVVRASTVIFPDTEAFVASRAPYTYGRRGTPTTEALTTAWSDLHSAAGTVLTPSGLCACSLALLSAAEAGGHVLVADTVYQPTRHFCETVLARLGVTIEFYDPLLGAGIAGLIRENTRAVYMESPGSLTFEMQDVGAIAAAARAAGALSIVDNTWATPVFFRPLAHGVDIVVEAGTKYLGGHADLNLGLVSANDRAWRQVKATYGTMGLTVSGDDAFTGLRGLRTLDVRLERHQASARVLAEWLGERPEVARVLYPALASDPGHAIWRRDFSGASGLLAVVLHPAPMRAVAAMLDGLELFGLGASWGGFESLAIFADPRKSRSATKWEAGGPLLRFHVGLEDVGDLIADLEAGFGRLRNAARDVER